MAGNSSERGHLLGDGDGDDERQQPQYGTAHTVLDEEELLPVKNAPNTLWWKLDGFILPMCAMLFLLSQMDRGSIGNARIAGLQHDLDMSDTEFSTALTFTLIPYILVQLPSNLLLKDVGFNIMIPSMVVLWGAVTVLQGFATTSSALILCRFLLGLFEGGLLPGVTLYLASFYPRDKLHFRISVMFATSSLTGAFSGLFAAGILKINGFGGRPGWAWIFIIEGVVTILFGIFAFYVLPSSPTDAHFLTNPEREWLTQKLRADGSLARAEDAVEDDFSWKEVKKALVLPQVLLLGIAGLMSGTQFSGLGYFEPSIVQSLGFSGSHAQLMSVPPFAITFLLSIPVAMISDRYRARGITAMLFSLISLLGFGLFLSTRSSTIRYISLLISVPGVYTTAPALGTWNANNVAPHSRRATALVVLSVATDVGAVAASWLLGTFSPPPNYTLGMWVFAACALGTFGAALANWRYLRRKNGEKALVRARMERREEQPGLGNGSAWFVYSL